MPAGGRDSQDEVELGTPRISAAKAAYDVFLVEKPFKIGDFGD